MTYKWFVNLWILCLNQYFFFSFFFLDGKFHVLPSGELLIHNLEYNDRFPTYKCRTMHRLTRQVMVSSTAKVRINGKS